MTCLLVVVGGLVTNTESGLAVPDWPTTFGYNMFLYPWSRMVGGILYEHAHRLLGSVVGMLTVLTAAVLFITEPRPGVRALGALAVAGVVVQGVLGGLRVVLVQETLAMLHGAVAPVFLALLVGLAVVTSPTVPARAGDAPGLRSLCLVSIGVLYLQILLGVVLTHTGYRLDAHLGGALLVSGLVPLLAYRAEAVAALRRPARRLRHLWIVQLVLGTGAYAVKFHGAALGLGPALDLAFPLAHRLVGALLLAAAVALAIEIFRSAGQPVPVRAEPAVGPASA
jgi:cytochrome c oxidase assembly protein subunit 15